MKLDTFWLSSNLSHLDMSLGFLDLSNLLICIAYMLNYY